MRTRKPSRSEVFENILDTLSAFEPMTYRDYAEMTGVNSRAAHTRLSKAHEAGLIHIARWHRGSSGPHLPAYAIGQHADAPNFDNLTDCEKRRRSAEKMKADPARWKEHLKKKRRYHKAKMKTDKNYAEKARAAGARYMRKKFGHKPRMPNLMKIDPLMAKIMGATA